MGYTHYWTHECQFTESEWLTISKDIKAICTATKAAGVPLDVSIGEIVDGGFVTFVNGVGDDAHETFCLYQSPGGWDFCKTARKPYDLAVTACLCYLESVYSDKFSVDSDGYAEDWKDGVDLAKSALPRLDSTLRIPASLAQEAA